MALIIDYEEQDYEVHGRVEKRELSGRSLSLLPRPALPMPDMVTELDGYISGLRSRALREFLSYLFQNEQLALDFARVPASRNH
ncbi:MAG: hypothetical protein HXS40_10970, partial [Theionarchaea archaeon]|nr:hypothetical protein [Theionarchaea archaeon]